MNFEPIDWKSFNRPPYLPQWLCRGETKKFAEFGDKQYMDIDGQIYHLSEQYDIDNAKAVLLDRIGKILSEPRDGNDDELYRLLIKLRILLNTCKGTVNEIIKVIKFIYSSEVVNMTPNYPAAITILHDGHNDSIDFNRIIAETIGAGIGYDTKEIFVFIEEMPSEDEFKINKASLNLIDTFNFGGFKFNGRAKHDGKTLNPKEYLSFPADGKNKFDGSNKHKPLLVPARTPVNIPIKPRKGIIDEFGIVMKFGFADIFRTPLKHNGATKADASRKFNGEGDIADYLCIASSYEMKDYFIITERLLLEAEVELKDSFTTNKKFNAEYKHNGMTKASAAIDVLSMTYKGTGLTDVFRTEAKHNGMIKADGKNKFDRIASISDALNVAEKYVLQDRITATEKHDTELKNNLIDYSPTQYKFDGKFKHNSVITASAAHEKLSYEIKTSATTDHVHINDVISVGMKSVHKHGGNYQANGKIKFNSGILIPA
jgi:hypothetical protein